MADTTTTTTNTKTNTAAAAAGSQPSENLREPQRPAQLQGRKTFAERVEEERRAYEATRPQVLSRPTLPEGLTLADPPRCYHPPTDYTKLPVAHVVPAKNVTKDNFSAMGSGLCGEAPSRQQRQPEHDRAHRDYDHTRPERERSGRQPSSRPASPSNVTETTRANSSRSSKSTQMSEVSEMNYDCVSESRPMQPPPASHAATAAPMGAMNQISILGPSGARAAREENPDVHARMVRAERMDGQEEALDERPFRQEKVVRVPTKAYLRPPKSPNQVIADPDANDDEYEYV